LWMGSCWQLLWSPLYVHLLLSSLAEGTTRIYYLGVREVEWNYAPKGKNVISGQSITNDPEASLFLQSAKNRVGSIYKKSVYKQYSDATYSTEVPKPAWLGFLGPLIRAEVGDTIVVHLKNFARQPYTIHPHGVFYEKDSEGSLYPDMSSQNQRKDDAVPPGGNHTYTWTVPEDHGPTADDPTCLTWIYHSHTDAPRDIASGLIGPLLTCKEGALKSVSQRRHDVDLDFFLMFSVVDENHSWYLDENIASFCAAPESVDKEDEAFQESNRMHTINGYVYGNLPEMTMCAGDHVSWHLFGMGNEIDVHTAFFHGQTLTVRGHRTDVASLFPATFVTAEMMPQNIGRWLLSCQVNDHLQAGMEALYEVRNCSQQNPEPALKGKLRKYYIAAKEVQWNYGPSGLDQSTGKRLQEPGSSAEQFFMQSHRYIGGRYWKAKYVEYTDATFRVEKEQSEEEKHLGIMGPVIKAEVGDTIWVTFANKASWPFSIQPHGVLYRKEWEGTLYYDGTFEIYCQTSNHYHSGMRESYSVSQCGTKTSSDPQYERVQTHYIMAEEVEWDYSPDRSWELQRHNLQNSEFHSYSNVFLSRENGLIGSKYKKAVYREYTDGTFRIPKNRTSDDEHLGILGPFIWAEVGDVLNIVFKNSATRPYSIHAHGVLEKNKGKTEATKPGEIVIYQWDIPERAGPGPSDSDCISWVYYSMVDPVKDLYSGLIGPLKVCRKGVLGFDGRRKGVDREFALLFLVFDENQSWYLEENVRLYAHGDRSKVSLQDEEFTESNKMHAINGKLYANLLGLTMYQGDWVNWYLLGMGQEIDLHTVHFHAETFIYQNSKSYRADVADLFPGTFEMVEMVVGNPGTWLLHCHVADHIHAGMETLFRVLPRPGIVATETSVPPSKSFVFGSKLDQGQVEVVVIVLAVAGIALFIVASVLLGVVIHHERQKKLRRNRRSILDEGFKLMSSKNLVI
uniref:Ceruloplasmin n=1 Tax=Sphenodon punctatus TaxID=8508 RepID=A0A8D0HPU9_SPHPU